MIRLEAHPPCVSMQKTRFNQNVSTTLFANLAILLWISVSFADQPRTESPSPVAADQVSSFTDLKLYAESLAHQSYQPEPPLLPELATLDYERYREIQFRHEAAIWDDGKHPFWLEFFHRGFVQQDRVDVYVIESDGDNQSTTSQVQYTPAQFEFGEINSDLKAPDEIGYAGLKVAGRFTPDGDAQEMLTFIGSSYFRARTEQTVYGTSARGLAVNIGMNQDEEFPDFRAFWITEPKTDQSQVTVLALLDSLSLTGAYQFTFAPDQSVSTINVEATLYFRKAVDKLAYAPLTSMWIWGDGLQGPPKDERPSVHDSDGLLVHADNRWQWRSFARLSYPSVSSISVQSLNGFGLLQRDRDFEHFLDSNARYHDRPSVWIEPIDSFGSGRIELLEIPGAHEGIDNIGAYFVPDRQHAKQEDSGGSTSEESSGETASSNLDPIDLKYRVSFFGKESDLGERLQPVTPNGQLLATCRSLDIQRHQTNGPIDLEIVFGLEAQDETARQTTDSNEGDDKPIRAAIRTVRGTVNSQDTKAIPNGYLCKLSITPTEDAPIELELTLQDSDGQSISETFRYLCPQQQPTFVYPAVYTRQE